MTLHIFNPEHDIALANGMRQVTPPHAARQLRNDLGFIPAFWAKEGDVVLVEDTEQAKYYYKRVCQNVARLFGVKTNNVIFADADTIHTLSFDDVAPWGWDYSIYSKVQKIANTVEKIPSRDDIERTMELSHRRTAAKLLPKLRTLPGTIGEMVALDDISLVAEQVAQQNGKAVLKAPWSSSGRGVRFITSSIDDSTTRWISNTFTKQHSIMMEPLYRRVADLGMEFQSHGDGTASYLGLSLFSTTNGAYTGNVIATETRKRELISRYIDCNLIDNIKDIVCSQDFSLLTSRYKGAFGIDMMVVNGEYNNGFLLHPCVEINLRRTMGHLALCLTPADDGIEGIMQVVFEGKFKLRIGKQ